MASYNKVILVGNLTRDPELRSLPSGMSVARISLAVNRRYTGKDGENKEEVTYVDVDVFGKQAETIAKYCAKGRPLLVEGRLRLDQWDDKTTGEKRSRLGVVLENFTFIGSRGDAPAGTPDYEDSVPPRRASSPRVSSNPPPAMSAPDIEEDIPF
ncbi:MAG: single-stranded DNA-binding protein [Opitutales bacterium]|nr:single-stranded DNA-binding protein [Opitutales bacterium]